MTGVVVRRMAPEDVPAVVAVAEEAFTPLYGRPPAPPPAGPVAPAAAHPESEAGSAGRRDAGARPMAPEARLARHLHLLATDPEGQWVAVTGDGEVVGAAAALRREGLWGLSLLAVSPAAQGTGLGAQLLGRALGTARDATGGLLVSSIDPRAMRRYARAGFTLAPTLSARGVVRRDLLGEAGRVRDGDAADFPAMGEVSRAVRGASHGPDFAAMVDSGLRLLVADGGYALVGRQRVYLLAATTPPVAAELLRAALLATDEGVEAEVTWLTERQGWALPVVLDAGLALRPDGPVCHRGDVGPLAPYVPSGAFL
jgi:GNAT superfamily N-acetyltransferase